VATFCHLFPPKKLLYLVHWLFFFPPFFSFFCGFLARIGKFVKKKKTGYSVFLGVVFLKDWQEKPFYLLHWLFFLFFFNFFWAASMREFSRKKEKKKIGYRAFSLFNDRFWFLQNSSN
jgi:cytochrome b561